jgi:hypothetical protein
MSGLNKGLAGARIAFFPFPQLHSPATAFRMHTKMFHKVKIDASRPDAKWGVYPIGVKTWQQASFFARISNLDDSTMKHSPV